MGEAAQIKQKRKNTRKNNNNCGLLLSCPCFLPSRTLPPFSATATCLTRKRAGAVTMSEIDPLVLSYSHLKDFPHADNALQALKKIASLVKPIMRARGWKVGQLTEFYPNEQNLLGWSQPNQADMQVIANPALLFRPQHQPWAENMSPTSISR